MSKSLVPLSEVAGGIGHESEIAWQLTLPPMLDPERFGIDLDRTHRIIKAAGFGGLVVEWYQGDASENVTTTPKVVGMSLDGTAVGVATATKTKMESNVTDINKDRTRTPYSEFRWPTARVAINRTDFASHISDKVGNGMDREKAWSTELDLRLRSGFRDVARKKLAQDLREQKLGDAQIIFQAAIEAVQATVNHDYNFTFGAAVIGIIYAYRATRNKAMTGETLIDRWRPSLFLCGVQPDRFALAALKSYQPGLIRNI